MVVRRRPPACDSELPSLSTGPKIHVAGDVGAGFLAHQIGEPARQFAFVGLGEGAVEHVGDDQPEHVVAEKFQPLVACGAIVRAASKRRNMRERALQQRLIGEFIADPLFQSGAILRLAAHLTIVNRRFQRTETGQRQNSQARSPS